MIGIGGPPLLPPDKSCSHCRRGHHQTCSGMALRWSGARQADGRTPAFRQVDCACATRGHPPALDRPPVP